MKRLFANSFRVFSLLLMGIVVIPMPARASLEPMRVVQDLVNQHAAFCRIFASSADCSEGTNPESLTSMDLSAQAELDRAYLNAALSLLPSVRVLSAVEISRYERALSELDGLYSAGDADLKRTITKLAHALNQQWLLLYGPEFEGWLSLSRDGIEGDLFSGYLIYSLVFSATYRWQMTTKMNRLVRRRLYWPGVAAATLAGTYQLQKHARLRDRPKLPPPPALFLTLDGELQKDSDSAARLAHDQAELERELGGSFVAAAVTAAAGPAFSLARGASGRLLFFRRMFASLKLTPASLLGGLAAGAAFDLAWSEYRDHSLAQKLMSSDVSNFSGLRDFTHSLNELDLLYLNSWAEEVEFSQALISFILAPAPSIRTQRLELDQRADRLVSYREMKGRCENPRDFLESLTRRHRDFENAIDRLALRLTKIASQAGASVRKQQLILLRLQTLANLRANSEAAAQKINDPALRQRLITLFPCPKGLAHPSRGGL